MNKRRPYNRSKHSNKKRGVTVAFDSSVQTAKPKMKGGKPMLTFVALLEKSILVQGLITSALVVTTCYLWATGQQVPQELWTADTIVIGFFFGSKVQNATSGYVARKRG